MRRRTVILSLASITTIVTFYQACGSGFRVSSVLKSELSSSSSCQSNSTDDAVGLSFFSEEKIDFPEDTWVRLSPSDKGQPSSRLSWEGSGVYDPVTKNWIHHAGHDGIPQGIMLFHYNVEQDQWKQVFTPNSPAGTCNIDGSVAYDFINRKMVRFTGDQLGHGFQMSRGVKLKNSVAWLYDPDSQTWDNPRTERVSIDGGSYHPNRLGRSNIAMTYDSKRGLIYQHGGGNAGGQTDDFGIYDAYDNRWIRMFDYENAPSARSGHALAYNAKNDLIILFGSQYSVDPKVYTMKPGSSGWQVHSLEPSPDVEKIGPYSSIPKMACDHMSDHCLAVNWRDGPVTTWLFDAKNIQWKKIETKADPSESMSRSRNLQYLPDKGIYVMELTSYNNRIELWGFRPSGQQLYPEVASPHPLKVSVQENEIQLEWKAVPGASHYVIERATGENRFAVTPKEYATSECTNFLDTNINSNTKYYYQVYAVNDQGQKSHLPASGRAQPRFMTAPIVSVENAQKVHVEWEASQDPNVVGYNIYRSLVAVNSILEGKAAPYGHNDPLYDEPRLVGVSNFAQWERLNDQILSKTSYIDTDVDISQPGPESGDYNYAVYAYRIEAVNALGIEGSQRSAFALTIPSEPRMPLIKDAGDGKIQIKWDVQEKFPQSYTIYRITAGSSFTVVPIKQGVTDTTVTLEEASNNVERYFITTTDRLGQEGIPSSPLWNNFVHHGYFEGEWHQ